MRRALRSLFAADVDLDGDLKGPARKVWFAEDWQEAPCGLGMMLDKVTGGMMNWSAADDGWSEGSWND